MGARRDGWTLERQAEFVGRLAETGSVLAAARAVSMGRESAYRLRKRPGAAGFAAAWDAALGVPREPLPLGSAKATGLPAWYRAEVGLLEVRVSAGRYLGFALKPDNNAIMQHLGTLYRSGRGTVGERRKPHSQEGRFA